MNESSALPGDPSELHLRISYDDGLCDTPQADTLERWEVAVLHPGAVRITAVRTRRRPVIASRRTVPRAPWRTLRSGR